MHGHIARHAVTADDISHAVRRRRRLGVRILGDEDEALPLLEPQLREVVVGGVEFVPWASTVRFMYGAPISCPSSR